jgi:hypothetical protein
MARGGLGERHAFGGRRDAAGLDERFEHDEQVEVDL